ncbi:MAG: hypothetical protein LBL01_01825 [Bifidobacteriaceae bacterium]|jgi:glycosyltransferase involved in cell wall biosynthesis|nr:hypothetical protein [Bifidobacteriaceae bacterium]
MKRKRILYVAWGFAPFRGSGVWNPLAAVNALARRGHDVTVLTADGATFDLIRGADWDLMERVEPGVAVVRVPHPPGVMDTLVNRWPAARAEQPGPWKRMAEERVRGIHPDPDGNGWFPAWRPAASAAARRLHAAAPFDLVIANILPAVAAGVALDLNADAGVPMALVERDSWVFNPFTAEPYGDAEASRPLLEEIYRRAVQVWYVNGSLADLHRREFAPWAVKIREVRNGWDPEFLPEPVTPPGRAGRDGLVFRFAGQMLAGFPWDFTREAWVLARQASPLLRRSTLEMVGTAARPGFGDPNLGIAMRGWTPRADLAALYAQTDALLFIKEGAGLPTTGKIYEYMATGLPIVSSMPPEYDPRGLLEGRPLWFDAAEHTPAGLAGALARAAEHVPTDQEAAAAREHALPFRRDKILDAAFDGLEAALGW